MDRLGRRGDYDLLELATRGFKGARVYDATGLPLHFDNQSIFKERIHLDKADPNVIHDEVHRDRPRVDPALDRGQEICARCEPSS